MNTDVVIGALLVGAVFTVILLYVIPMMRDDSETTPCSLDGKTCGRDCECIDCEKYKNWKTHFNHTK